VKRSLRREGLNIPSGRRGEWKPLLTLAVYGRDDVETFVPIEPVLYNYIVWLLHIPIITHLHVISPDGVGHTRGINQFSSKGRISI
jgi:hypothetical protein